MRLLFTGVLAPSLLLLLFLTAAAYTCWIYRRHRLPKPWRFWLPAIRIAALALLVAALLQPVVARFQSETIRGQIPVLVDTSGSMALTDRYPAARRVEIAWTLGLFPAGLRDVQFQKQAEAWKAWDLLLNEANRSAQLLGTGLEGGAPWNVQLTEKGETVASATAAVADALRTRIEAARAVAESRGYLKESLAVRNNGLRCLYYDNISGAGLNAINLHPAYPNAPTAEGMLNEFKVVRNDQDSSSARVLGYLVPEKTGEHLFTLAAGGEASLFVGTDASFPETPSVSVNNSQATSPKVSLTAGRVYAVCAEWKKGNRQDELVVGWQTPDGKSQMPIPGANLWYKSGPQLTYRDTLAALEDLAARFTNLSRGIRSACKAESPDKGRVILLLEHLKELSTERSELPPLPDALQAMADEALAYADIREVNAGLRILSGMTRHDVTKHLLLSKPTQLLRYLQKVGDVSIFTGENDAPPLSEAEFEQTTASQPATRLGSRIRQILKYYEKQPVAAFVVLSDGNNNAGASLQDTRRALMERDIPLLSLGVGSPEPPPDVAIKEVLASRTAFTGNWMNVSVTLCRRGFEHRPIRLQITSEQQTVMETTIEPGTEEQATVHLSFAETHGGVRQYTVSTEYFENEAFKHNNQERFTVNILEDWIRALLLDEFPRWESRYANMMLSKDKRVALTTIFIGSTAAHALPGKTGEAKESQGPVYPATREELFGYDIVILGDVNPRHFTMVQMEDLRAFVTDRGGTLVTMAGPRYMPARYARTPLATVIPLRSFEGAVPVAARHTPSYHMRVAGYAEFDDVIQIGSTPELSGELWTQLPRVSWVHEGVTPSRAADMLITADPNPRASAAGPELRLEGFPLMIKAYAGLGKSLYLGSDEFWRWRDRAGGLYHHRFWGQILLWATMGRTTGEDTHVKLMADRPVYAPEETIIIQARILNDESAPIADADASLEVHLLEQGQEDLNLSIYQRLLPEQQVESRPAGLLKVIPLIYLQDSGGEYRAQIHDLPKGRYRVIPKVRELKEIPIQAQVTFEVRDLASGEYVDLALNQRQLREISDHYLPFEQVAAMIDKVPRIEFEEVHRKDTEIWDTFLFMLLVGLLLGFEWTMRKKLKLV